MIDHLYIEIVTVTGLTIVCEAIAPVESKSCGVRSPAPLQQLVLEHLQAAKERYELIT